MAGLQDQAEAHQREDDAEDLDRGTCRIGRLRPSREGFQLLEDRRLVLVNERTPRPSPFPEAGHQRTLSRARLVIAPRAATIQKRTTTVTSCQGAAPATKIPPWRSSPW